MTHSPFDDSIWVERTVENHSVVVRAGGELDLRAAPVLGEQLALAEAIVVPPAPVVLDLTGIEFMGSAGLSLLMEHHERCLALGTRLLIVPGSSAVTRPLMVTGLDRVLNLTAADEPAPTVAD